jgi:Glutathione S-transferase, N-terminal domain
MSATITAFERSPDRGKGLARDTRVRWALEEVGQPYEVRLVSFAAMKEPAHRALHPFAQIPTYEQGDLVLFERQGCSTNFRIAAPMSLAANHGLRTSVRSTLNWRCSPACRQAAERYTTVT